MKTRNYYVRHWGYVVIRRSCSLDDLIFNVFYELRKLRSIVDYGLFGLDLKENSTFDFIVICLRKSKPLRYDSISRRFPKSYVTRISINEQPSEIARKWRVKHSDQDDGQVPPVCPFGHGKHGLKFADVSDLGNIDELCMDFESSGYMERFEAEFDETFLGVNKQ